MNTEFLSLDLIDIFGIIVIFIDCFIFVPILLYCLCKFIQLKDTEVMKHRKSKLVYTKTILSIIGIGFERLFVCSVTVWNINLFDQYKWLIYVSDGIFIWGVFILFFMKIWLLFYSIAYHQSLAKDTWKKEINSQYKSWYISHKNTCGNFNCLLKMLIIPFFLYIALEIYIDIYHIEHISNHSLAISSLILLIPSFKLYCKLKTNILDDVFGIKKEIGYQCFILFIIMLLYIALSITDIFLFHNNNSKTKLRIEWLIRIFIGSLVLFLMSFVSTYFPIRQYKYNQLLYSQQMEATKDISDTDGIKHSHGVKSMIHVLADEQGFKGFMMHLVNEFSTENLLYIYEYIQIKNDFQIKCNGLLKLPKPKSKVPKSQLRGGGNGGQSITVNEMTENDKKQLNDDEEYITVDLNVDQRKAYKRTSIFTSNIRTNTGISSYIFNSNGSIFSRIELPPNLPKSQLLNENDRFIDRLYTLFLKYIKRGSILEINISCIQRKRITKAFNDILNRINIKLNGDYNHIQQTSDSMENECINNEENELNFNMFTIMDSACIEILLLMNQSYARFTKSINGNKINIIKKLNNLDDSIQMIDYRQRALS
eukprot:353832_1